MWYEKKSAFSSTLTLHSLFWKDAKSKTKTAEIQYPFSMYQCWGFFCLFVHFVLLLFLSCIEKIQTSSLIFLKEQEIVINIYILLPLCVVMKNRFIVYGNIRTATHLFENSSLLPCVHSEESTLVNSVVQELQYQAPYFVFYSLLSLGIITDKLPFEDGVSYLQTDNFLSISGRSIFGFSHVGKNGYTSTPNCSTIWICIC